MSLHAIYPDQSNILSNNDYAFIAELVEKRIGIALNEERHYHMIQRRLLRRLLALNIDTFSSYCDLLRLPEHEDEIAQVINLLTTNITPFFRDDHHFEHLKEMLIRQNNQHIRIWSTVCSSGEEPYSIAMTLADALKDYWYRDAKILATDSDVNILMKAKTGIYPGSIKEGLPAGYMGRYTLFESADTISLIDDIKQLVHFNQLNLLEEWPINGPFDAIFCRNVFIYFTQEMQEKIINRFIDLLKPDGILYMGYSDNLQNITDRLETVGRAIYRKVR